MKKLCVVQVTLQVVSQNSIYKKNELLSGVDKSENSYTVKGKAIPLQAWTDPEGSRRLRLLDFKTIST